MKKIELHTIIGNHCDIWISSHLSECDALLQQYIPAEQRIIAIVDENVEKRYGRFFPFEKILLTANENNKSLRTVEVIIRQLLLKEADKNTFLLGIGGGITTDITGFVASIYKRGINFGFIPTTLLAMTDAAIGGKNGVNMLAYKNMVGTIRQPKFVYVCPQFLKSFSPTELYKGIPELLKVFLIDGKDYFYAADFFVRQYEQVCKNEKLDLTTWQELITKAIRIKCQFVEQDEMENGARRLLNLGHTFAHAIEHSTSQYSHGEAVGIGLVLSARKGHFPHIAHLIHTLKDCGLPYQLPETLPNERLHEAILQDKKSHNGQLRLIILEEVGKVTIKEELL